jgi:membrane-bound ClpP family serine protease
VTPEQVIPAAIVAVILILVIAGIVRAAGRRRGANEQEFGAGGVTKVPVGTTGVAQTPLAPAGVVYLLGEQWTARSRTGTAIPIGGGVRVVDHDGLTLIVDGQPAPMPATE